MSDGMSKWTDEKHEQSQTQFTLRTKPDGCPDIVIMVIRTTIIIFGRPDQ